METADKEYQKIQKLVQIVELKDDSSITGDLNQILAPESQIRQDLLSILTDDLYDFDKNMDKKNYKKETEKYPTFP